MWGDALSSIAGVVKDIGVIAAFVVPPFGVLYRYWIRAKVRRAKAFMERVGVAADMVPSLAEDVAMVKAALGPNGGKSIGALVVRTDARLSLLIDSQSTLTWEAQSDGHNVRVNRAFEDWCGWSAADLRGNGWKVLLHPEDADDYVDAWESACADRRPFRYGPVRLVKKDGRTETVRVLANPSSIADNMTYWLGIVERSS